jgi:hypothetical protein
MVLPRLGGASAAQACGFGAVAWEYVVAQGTHQEEADTAGLGGSTRQAAVQEGSEELPVIEWKPGRQR